MAGVGHGLICTLLEDEGEHLRGAMPPAKLRACAVRSLSSAFIGLALYAAAVPAGAQNPADAATRALPPVEILASVRSAGFNPVSRPVQRGPVYLLFATDRYFFDVRLTVDARSGRVLTATRLAGASHGGPVYEGALPGSYPFYERGQRGPVPPAAVPGRRNGTAAAAAPQPLLPRARRDEVGSATVAPTQGNQPAPGEAAVQPPPRLPQPAAAAQPGQKPPAMVPIAPLE